jgi:adenylosuccinate lyase
MDIPRYTNPEMGRIWSDQRKYETWLQVETAAVDAMARRDRAGRRRARHSASAAIRHRPHREIERITQHDVIAFTTAVAETSALRALAHFGHSRT